MMVDTDTDIKQSRWSVPAQGLMGSFHVCPLRPLQRSITAQLRLLISDSCIKHNRCLSELANLGSDMLECQDLISGMGLFGYWLWQVAPFCGKAGQYIANHFCNICNNFLISLIKKKNCNDLNAVFSITVQFFLSWHEIKIYHVFSECILLIFLWMIRSQLSFRCASIINCSVHI